MYYQITEAMGVAITRPSNKRKTDAQKFRVDCLPFIFTMEELEILEHHGYILKDLSEGRRSPHSTEEKNFVKCAKGQKEATTSLETAWMKYMNRTKLEAMLLPTEELYREYIGFRRQNR